MGFSRAGIGVFSGEEYAVTRVTAMRSSDNGRPKEGMLAQRLHSQTQTYNRPTTDLAINLSHDQIPPIH